MKRSIDYFASSTSRLDLPNPVEVAPVGPVQGLL